MADKVNEPKSDAIKRLDAIIEFMEQFYFYAFVTLTLVEPYRYDFSRDRCFKLQRVINTFILNLNSRIYGNDFRKRQQRISVFYVIDWDSGKGVHIHALFETTPKLNQANYPFPQIVEYEWNKVHAMTGHVDYKNYDPSKGAIGYICGKELTKGYEVVYDYFRTYY